MPSQRNNRTSKRHATTAVTAAGRAACTKKRRTSSGGSEATCRGCGIPIHDDDRALQCDKCGEFDAWKCIKCLNISVEVYDALTTPAGTNFKWFCDHCDKDDARDGETMSDPAADAMEIASDQSRGHEQGKLDEIMRVLGQLLDKSTVIEHRLDQKADVATVNQLELRIKKIEDRLLTEEAKTVKLDEKLSSEIKSVATKQTENASTAQVETVNLAKVVHEVVTKQKEVELENESRKLNIIMYRVPEVKSDDPKIRKEGDGRLVQQLCNDVLEVKVGGEDIVRLFRLGKRSSNGKDRPLLVGFQSIDKKVEIMGNLKKLATADETFKNIGVAHDLTPKQREAVKNALHEARSQCEQEDHTTKDDQKNWKFIVKGQTSLKPRVLRVKRN